MRVGFMEASGTAARKLENRALSTFTSSEALDHVAAPGGGFRCR